MRITIYSFLTFCFLNSAFAICDSTNIVTNFQIIPTICNSNIGQISIISSYGGEGPYQYAIKDTNFSSQLNYSNLKEGSYRLLTKDMNGCLDTNTFVISNKSIESEISIQKAFSPNSDGINDELKIIISANISKIDLVIVNQYGATVFRTNSTFNYQTWDGKSTGINVTDGTYYYIINAETACEKGSFTGFITLLR